MKKIALLASACFLMLGSTSAFAATVYTANRAVGTGFVNLSITTDDTIGVIGDGNILDWDITVTQGLDVFSIEGPGGANNSTHLISGSGLTATATDLYFNFSVSGLALFQSPFVGAGQTFWCVQNNGCFDFAGPAEGLLSTANFNTFSRQSYQGNQIIASAGGGVVPEPATWALMITGFGLAGSALRSARRVVAAS